MPAFAADRLDEGGHRSRPRIPDLLACKGCSRLKADERQHLYAWLGTDYVFALVYTMFFTGALRSLAAQASSDLLGFVGRSLSWVAAFAIVFDLTENAILWAAASTAAPQVSPWLESLARLKFLSLFVFLGYTLAWLGHRWWKRRWAT